MPLTIEITSDFMCPWCLIAESRLHRAIAQLGPAADIQMVWRPFELNPTMPEMGIDRTTYRTTKFGCWEYSQQLDAQTIQAAQADGIQFRYDWLRRDLARVRHGVRQHIDPSLANPRRDAAIRADYRR